LVLLPPVPAELVEVGAVPVPAELVEIAAVPAHGIYAISDGLTEKFNTYGFSV
jgi:hypothetical protein